MAIESKRELVGYFIQVKQVPVLQREEAENRTQAFPHNSQFQQKSNIMADSSLPDSIVESIAISNAKSIGEQPAILANLALANQILNQNLQQQMAISQQQAINQVTLATTAKCVSVITGDDASSANIDNLMKVLQELKSGGNPSPKTVEGPLINPGKNDPGEDPPADIDSDPTNGVDN